MRRFVGTWLRPLGGAGILAFLLWRLGTGPFIAGLRLLSGWALGSAVLIGAITTGCCAWRWSLVARGLGVTLPLRTAVAHCYRSVFLNATLPGGVLGDVHRAVSHGRDVGDVGRGIRAVVLERTAGQVVQAAMALVVLSAFPSPVRPYMPIVTGVAVAVAVVAVLAARVMPHRGVSRWARALRAARADIRDGLLARGNWLAITGASALVVAGHLATFLIAAHTAGATASLLRLAPLTLLALLAMGLPINVGGFGPREGVAAWAFGAAGLTADQGVATAVVYGALVLAASLPGVCVLLVPRLRGARQHRSTTVTAAQGTRARFLSRPIPAEGRRPMSEAPPVATIRTQVTVPLRFPDGYTTTARVFTFDGLVDAREHLALGLGDWEGSLDRHAAGGAAPLVRPHSECLTGDVFGSQRCDCGPQLREAVERIAEAGGFLLYLRQEGRGIGLYAKLDAYALQDSGMDTYQANVALGHGEDERDYTAAAQMLCALGAEQFALLSNNPDKAEQLTGLGVTVTEQVATGVYLSPTNASYLAAKANRAARSSGLPVHLLAQGV